MALRIFGVTFALLVLSAPAFCSISYKVVSATVHDSSPCLSTCTSSGKCYYDHHLNEVDCYADYSAGVPTFYTVNPPGNTIFRCLSNCGKFGGKDYNWCYTTENYDWNYCNPVVYSPTEKWGRTIYGDLCIDDCLSSSEYSSTQCHAFDQSYVKCARPATVSVQSCRNIFSIDNGDSHRSPRAPQLDYLFSATPACRSRVRDGYPGETANRMQDVLQQSSLGIYPVERIVQFPAGSPYTFVATRNETNSNGDLVYLPLVVQATLHRPQQLPPRTRGEVPQEAAINTANMYDGDARGRDAGHIVAFINGGTRDLFNFVSQTRATNRGPYKMIEIFINKWINSGLGYVEFTVVVDYVGTTVNEFAIKLKLFNNDGSLHSDCMDIIVANI